MGLDDPSTQQANATAASLAYLAKKKKKKRGYEREKTSPALKKPARSSSSRKPKPRRPTYSFTIRRGEDLMGTAGRVRTTPTGLLAANPQVKFAMPGLVLRPPRSGGALGGAYGGMPAPRPSTFNPPSYATGKRKSEDVLPEARPPARFGGPRPANAYPTAPPSLPPVTSLAHPPYPLYAPPVGSSPYTAPPAPNVPGTPMNPPTAPIDMNDVYRARAVGANWWDVTQTISSGNMPLVIYEETAAQLGIDTDMLENQLGYTWDENTHKWISPEFLKAESSQPTFGTNGGGGARNYYSYGWGGGGGGGGGGGRGGGGYGYSPEEGGNYFNGFGLVSWRI
jgi:hypothetical protein